MLSALTVSSGFDEADNEIVRRCEAGDLVITADIPLAADVLAKRFAQDRVTLKRHRELDAR